MQQKETSSLPHPKRKRQWAYPRDRVAHDAYNKQFKQQRLQRQQQRTRQQST